MGPAPLLAWSLACGGGEDTSTDVPDPTDTEDRGTTGETGGRPHSAFGWATHTGGVHSSAWTGPGVRGTLSFRSSLSGNPLLGVVCEAEGRTASSDAAGVARLVLSEDSEVAVSCANGVHLGVIQTVRTGVVSGWGLELELVTEGELDSLATALQIGAPEPENGLIGVTVVDGLGQGLGGSRVEIDRPSTGSMVSDTSTPLGHARGDTLPAGTSGLILFSNVEPGPARVTVTPPAGLSCGAWPAEEPVAGLEVAPGAISAIRYVCR